LSPRARRVCVGLLLVGYFLWPLVHQQLVSRYRTDPWKLAGWAMYSAPSARVRVHLVALGPDGQRVRIDPKESKGLVTELDDFVRRRRTLGLFVEPESVVRKLIEVHPEAREWTVVVDQVGLNGENRFGVIHRSVYHYPIDGGRPGAVSIEYPAIPEAEVRSRGRDRTAALADRWRG